MIRVFVLGLFIIFSFLCDAHAQDGMSTKISRIEVDGKVVRKKYNVFLRSSGKWMAANKTRTGFVLPNNLTTEEYLDVLVTFGKYQLEFLKLHVSNFREDWVVGVDEKPFSPDFVNPEDASITKRVYYIQFEGSEPGRQLIIAEKKAQR
jgi:hypothetical protein